MTPRLQFGVSLLPSVQPLSAHLELVHAAESSGLDLIGIQDHPGRLADGWAAPIPSYLPYERWSPVQQQIDTARRAATLAPSDGSPRW
jgi:hypothetical protein